MTKVKRSKYLAAMDADIASLRDPLAMRGAAHWSLRLPVIRHIRAAVWTWRINRHYDLWRSLGRPGGWTTYEIAWVEAIRRGDA